jgi:lipid-A-disaccharide synthase
LMLDRPVMPEFLQEDCTAEAITPILSKMLDDVADRQQRRADMEEAMVKLGFGGVSPAGRAARVVLDFIAERKTP